MVGFEVSVKFLENRCDICIFGFPENLPLSKLRLISSFKKLDRTSAFSFSILGGMLSFLICLG